MAREVFQWLINEFEEGDFVTRQGTVAGRELMSEKSDAINTTGHCSLLGGPVFCVLFQTA